jgi:hypothetical protein
MFAALGHADNVAILARLSSLEVCKGREFLADHPPYKLIVIHRSALKFRGGSGSDKVTCAWLLWAQKLSGPPIVCVGATARASSTTRRDIERKRR